MKELNKEFYKLDKTLIKILAPNRAIVLTCLIENATTWENSFFYQQERLINDTGLSKATLIKILDELEELRFISRNKNNEKHLNYFSVNFSNIEKLINLADKENYKKPKDQNYKKYLENYKSSIKINTTSSSKINTCSSSKIDTTYKDLNLKELDNNNYSVSHQAPFKDFIKNLNDEEKNKLNNYFNSNPLFYEFINKFLNAYMKKYHKYHLAPKDYASMRKLLNNLISVFKDNCLLETGNGLLESYSDIIIDEFFKMNKKDLTLYLLASSSEYIANFLERSK